MAIKQTHNKNAQLDFRTVSNPLMLRLRRTPFFRTINGNKFNWIAFWEKKNKYIWLICLSINKLEKGRITAITVEAIYSYSVKV